MVAFNMIALFSGASAASYTTEAPPAPLYVPRMLGGTGLRTRRELRVGNYELVSSLNGKIYECENNNCLDDKLYTSKKAASEACDKNPACGFITCKTINEYLLRRSSETKTQLCTSCLTFSKPQIAGLPFIADKPGKLTKNNLVDTVPYVSSEYRVSFDLWVDTIGHWGNDTPQNEWQNVLRLKGAESGPGFRIPYLTFHGGNKWLHVCSYVGNNPNRIVIIEKTFPLKQWVKIVIEQKKEGGEYVYKVFVEGLDNRVIKYKDDVNNRDFGNVSVYAGEPGDEPGDEPVDGYIRNLSITSADPFTATRNGWSSGCAGGNCINKNLGYTSKEEALGQCLNPTHQCDAVMRWINGKFYLRRLEDSIFPNALAKIYTRPKTDRACPKKLVNESQCHSHCDCQRRCTPSRTCHC